MINLSRDLYIKSVKSSPNDIYWKVKLYCIGTIYYYREIPVAAPGTMSILVGSPQYMSPEMLANKPYDEKVCNN
jgi:hypothetical protein